MLVANEYVFFGLAASRVLKMVGDIQILSMNDVVQLTSLSRTQVNKYRLAGKFPAAVSLGAKRLGFVKKEVTDWIEARIAERDSKAA